MEADQEGEKPFEATPRKLEKARQQGEVAVSQEIVGFSVYVAFLAVLFLLSSWMVQSLGSVLHVYIAKADVFAQGALDQDYRTLHQEVVRQIILTISPLFLAPLFAVLAVSYLQGAFSISFGKLQPKVSRISILKNARQKYGTEGLFSFFKSALKLVVFIVVLITILIYYSEEIVFLTLLPFYDSISFIIEIASRFLLLSVLFMAVISVIDLTWQRFQFAKRQRMSLQEIRDELKETEGDPHTKQQRARMAKDIAATQMLADVPKADVVIVNPEHYAVALKWDRKTASAPVCLAKGYSHVALSIKEAAMSHSVPVFCDPPTARAVYATVEIGEQIKVEHYHAVAAAIRFSEMMKSKARRGR